MQDYVIKDFRVGNFIDNNGNNWSTVTFDGYGEPCIWVVKDPESTPERFTIGKTAYGEIKDFTNKNNKTSPRFYASQKPEAAGAPGSSPASSSFKADKPFFRDASTLPLDCWRTLINIVGVPSNPSDAATFWELVMTHSSELMKIIDKVREGDKPAQTAPVASTGYSKFKGVGNQLKAVGEVFNGGEPLPSEEDMPPEFLEG